MPCNSDYMNPNDLEENASTVLCLLAELKGQYVRPEWRKGYHPSAYCKGMTKAKLDALVADLCGKLKGEDVTQYSLEMQIWWRDHLAADAAREAEERKEADLRRLREQALSNLTPEERAALGFK